MFKFSITDHRARPTQLYGLRDDLPRTASFEGVPADVRRRIEDRLRTPLTKASNRYAWAVSVACIMLSLWLVPVLMKSGLSAYAWAPLLVVANVGAWMACAFVYRWLVHRGFTSEFVAAFLADKRCPACTYDLDGAAAGADGCTVCPECGAAWRVGNEP